MYKTEAEKSLRPTAKTFTLTPRDRARLGLLRQRWECLNDSETIRKALKLAVEQIAPEEEA